MEAYEIAHLGSPLPSRPAGTGDPDRYRRAPRRRVRVPEPLMRALLVAERHPRWRCHLTAADRNHRRHPLGPAI